MKNNLRIIVFMGKEEKKGCRKKDPVLRYDQ